MAAGEGGKKRPGGAELGMYVHVPYCSVRCGYCDFNTYVPGEDAHSTQRSWRDSALAELDRAAAVLGTDRSVATVFFGGGTPTLLPSRDLGAVLNGISQRFGLQPGAEVTTEANPETVTPQVLEGLLGAGFTRISLGMQSADPRILSVLDRTHTPGGAVAAARAALRAGFDRVSLDLIYGSPGEDLDSWRRTLDAALDAGVGHISAYALKVEQGTALHRRVRAGDVPAPDDDYAAAAYETADEVLSTAGLDWYEISNWAVAGQECRHNLLYWRGGDWWGVGPGAHSHMAGVRWWNHRNPRRWTAALAEGSDPAAGREELARGDRITEWVMLRLRLAEGLPLREAESWQPAPGWKSLLRSLESEGLVECGDAVVLTRSGRLLADAVTLRLLDCFD